MEKPSFKLVGSPCGQHGQYTFYKAIRLTIGEKERIVAIGDFFFVRIWQDSELVSVGELQLLWTDRASDQTLVSLRLYFLPENTPDGRNQHGEDEVLAINDKVVVRAEDLLSWVCDGTGWRWGLRAVWRGACAPPQDVRPTQPLHQAKLDFSDVDREKSAIVDTESPGVVVFSYPRYCRYRALLARLEGIQGDWLRDSLVAALGGYAAPTTNTRILYCKDTFEYPELEGHEFVCNELAPKLKGRPRGRRRRASPDASASPDSAPDSEPDRHQPPPTSRRLSLRNGAGEKRADDEEERDAAEDRAFLHRLRQFHADRGEPAPLKDLSLRSLYARVRSRGGYEAVCRRRLWRALAAQPARARNHYERYLLPLEKHESRNGARPPNGLPARPPPTIELRDSPPPPQTPHRDITQVDPEPLESKDELNLVSKPAEELNREFLESLPKEEKCEKPLKITVKPVEKLIETNSVKCDESEVKHEVKSDRKVIEESDSRLSDGSPTELANKCNLGSLPAAPEPRPVSALGALSALGDKYNGHDANADQKSGRPLGRSSLRAVRVKPGPRAPPPSHAGGSLAGSAPINNFGIHRPPPPDDDEIVEVPYKPKSPEIIDLDEYPESPQSVKKKKLDILKERGLEVTAVPPWPLSLAGAVPPLMAPAPMIINPAMQTSLYQLYNIIPPNFNGVQPPKVIQGTGIFGSSGPEKTVYGNPKDPFMPPPHVLHGTPVKPQRAVPQTPTPQDILDLTCKTDSPKPAVEIVRVPSAPSPSKNNPQNLSKNYKLMDGKAVVGSNLEITLVNPKVQTPPKNRPPQKRSSNGKFMSSKTPTPPKEARSQTSPSPSPSGPKKNPIVVPNYQINARDDVSPTSSTGSRDSQPGPVQPSLSSMLAAQGGLALLGLQKGAGGLAALGGPGALGGLGGPGALGGLGGPPGADYARALYHLGHLDPRHLAAYRDVLANQFRGSRDSQPGPVQPSLSSMLAAQGGLALLGLQKGAGGLAALGGPGALGGLGGPGALGGLGGPPGADYARALYHLGHLDPRHLAAYRDVLANQFRGSRDSQPGPVQPSLSSMLAAQGGLALLGLQKGAGGLAALGGPGALGGLGGPGALGGLGGPPGADYARALYHLGHLDPRHLAAYRDVLANQFRGYPGLLSMGAVNGPPTTKN